MPTLAVCQQWSQTSTWQFNMHAITFRFEMYRCQALTYQGKLPGVIIHNPSFVTRKENIKKNVRHFSQFFRICHFQQTNVILVLLLNYLLIRFSTLLDFINWIKVITKLPNTDRRNLCKLRMEQNPRTRRKSFIYEPVPMTYRYCPNNNREWPINDRGCGDLSGELSGNAET
jgi:hypothetical protein